MLSPDRQVKAGRVLLFLKRDTKPQRAEDHPEQVICLATFGDTTTITYSPRI
jgi:hypothetical protein